MPYGADVYGRRDLGGGCHAWIPPDGGWGYANAGLVVGDGAALLVDTLFDLRLTRRMLTAFGELTARSPITTVVNTHANGDHWFGNELLPQAEIVACAAAAREMREVGPAEVAQLLATPGPAGRFAREIFGSFHFGEVTPRYPTHTFTGRRAVCVGGVDVELIEVGPAHTGGDVIVHVPSARVVFAGDILFNGGTPIAWTGPLDGWLAACQLLLDLDVDVIVPGHGPIAGKSAVREAQDYLWFVRAEATRAHAAGLGPDEAARTIAHRSRYAARPEAERLAANVHAVYRDIDPSLAAAPGPHLFGCMAALLEA